MHAPLQAAGQTLCSQAAPAFGLATRTASGRFVVQARVLGRDIDLIRVAVAQ